MSIPLKELIERHAGGVRGTMTSLSCLFTIILCVYMWHVFVLRYVCTVYTVYALVYVYITLCGLVCLYQTSLHYFIVQIPEIPHIAAGCNIV